MEVVSGSSRVRYPDRSTHLLKKGKRKEARDKKPKKMSIHEDEGEEASYIDYETFLAPDFKPSTFANGLVLATNNPNDAPLDLSTPLSKVLFDAQEIDSHIDLLTTRSALPLLTHTRDQTDASGRIIADIDQQVKSLNESYRQLEKEVIQKHAEADEVRLVASRLWETLRLGRSVGRCLQLGRQLEAQHAEISGTSSTTGSGSGSGGSGLGKGQDHRALVRCAHTILSLREVLERKAPGEEGHGLEKVHAVRGVRDGVLTPAERAVRTASEQIVREFSVGSAAGAATFAQSEEARSRTVSAMTALYLLSPTGGRPDRWTPQLLLGALDVYLRNALQSSTASLARSLATLPSLDRTLAEVTARCQNIVALEVILETTKAPAHPLLATAPPSTSTSSNAPPSQQGKSGGVGGGNLLQPLLAHLETGSLASYFWRTMAGALAPRVQEIMARGGVSARTLRSNRTAVADAIRECVVRGCQAPSAVVATTVTASASAAGQGGKAGKTARAADPERNGGAGAAAAWEREIAVMVGSVVGNLGR